MTPKQRLYEQARLKGLTLLLQECQNGRTVHEIGNVRAVLTNLLCLLEQGKPMTKGEVEILEEVVKRAKAIIRREKGAL